MYVDNVSTQIMLPIYVHRYVCMSARVQTLLVAIYILFRILTAICSILPKQDVALDVINVPVASTI